MAEGRPEVARLGSLAGYDAIVVGAGVVGAAIFRELCRFPLRVLLLDQLHDVGGGASRANTAILHGGFDPLPGTLMSSLNVEGLRLWSSWSRQLDVEIEWCGSLVLATDDEELAAIGDLSLRGQKAGVPTVFLLRDALLNREPNLAAEVKGGLFAPVSGLIDPFRAVIAMVGNGLANGGELALGERVLGLRKTPGGIEVQTSKRALPTSFLFNAAGVEADHLMRLAGEDWFAITPRRGQYHVLDKSIGHLVRHVLFPAPRKLGKGIVVTRTIHGNLMIGPNAEDLDKSDLPTTREGLQAVLAGAKKLIPFPFERYLVAQFSGLRAVSSTGDFHLGPAHALPGMFHAAGIKSPGLTAAPAIARKMVEMWQDSLPGAILLPGAQEDQTSPQRNIAQKADWDPAFRFPPKLSERSLGDRDHLIRKNPAYGRIVCRCEGISEGEVREAIRMQPGATDLDGLKRRCRPTTGRCQGGFCTPRLVEILAQERGVPLSSITKFGETSRLTWGDNRESSECE